MVKKIKYILLTVLFLLGIFTTLNLVNAAETYTKDGVTATKIVENNEGTIEFKLTNLVLDEGKEYVWAISKSNDATKIESWKDLIDYNSTSKSVSIDMSSKNDEMKAILK